LGAVVQVGMALLLGGAADLWAAASLPCLVARSAQANRCRFHRRRTSR